MLRRINIYEKEVIEQKLYEYWRINIRKVLGDKIFLVITKNGNKEVYAIPKEHDNILKKLKRYNYLQQLVYLGLFIGTIETRPHKIIFYPSLELGYTIYRYAKRNLVKVTRKGEQVFLYGRDIFASSILSILPPLIKKHYVIVVNTTNEYLGLGIALMSLKSTHELDKTKLENQNRVIIKNFIDLGWYLRQGG